MEIFLKRTLLLAIFGLASLVAQATTYYVNPNGNNSANGLTPGTAWKTIAYAVTKPFVAGDIIKLSAGTFVESGQSNVPLGVSIEGAGIDQTFIKAASSFYFNPADPGFALDKFLMTLSSASPINGNQSLKNFTVDGDGKKLHGGIYIKNRNGIVIENIHVTGTNFCAIWLWDVKDATISNVSTLNCAWGSSGWSSGALQLANIENLDISQLNISEGPIAGRPRNPIYWGYGIKALPHTGNTMKNVKLHDFQVSVDSSGAWNNGAAPNISIELMAGPFHDFQIYKGYVDNHISLVSVPTEQSAIPFKIYDNKFDILGPRTQGKGYCLELSLSNVEIYNNWFYGGSNSIVNWDPGKKYAGWNIHHNTFYLSRTSADWPTGIITTHKNAIENAIITNNTVEMAGTGTIDFLVFDNRHTTPINPTSNNITVSKNLIIDSQTSYRWWTNRVVSTLNGAAVSNVNVTNNWFQTIVANTVSGVSYSNNGTGWLFDIESGRLQNASQSIWRNRSGR